MFRKVFNVLNSAVQDLRIDNSNRELYTVQEETSYEDSFNMIIDNIIRVTAEETKCKVIDLEGTMSKFLSNYGI